MPKSFKQMLHRLQESDETFPCMSDPSGHFCPWYEINCCCDRNSNPSGNQHSRSTIHAKHSCSKLKASHIGGNVAGNVNSLGTELKFGSYKARGTKPSSSCQLWEGVFSRSRLAVYDAPHLLSRFVGVMWKWEGWKRWLWIKMVHQFKGHSGSQY
jgi:hypothetical protein